MVRAGVVGIGVERVGFIADHDHQVSDVLRFVQLTPPGSACSIALTSGAHQMPPGSIEGLQMVVEDAEASRRELAERGVEVSDVQVFPWGSFVFFEDPDGDGWALQAAPLLAAQTETVAPTGEMPVR